MAEAFEGAQVTGADPGYDAATVARLARLYPSLELVRDAPTRRFDVVLALDVAEHVEDDSAFVRRIVHEWLAEDGHLVFSVPAYSWLWSSHDVGLRHVRRYAPAEARALLERGGLTLVERGGLFGSLLLPRAVAVGLEHLRGPTRTPPQEGAIAWHGPAWLTSLLMRALGADAWISARAARAGLPLPGLSYWAIARRAGSR